MTAHKHLNNVATLELDTEKCVGCGICATVCPHGVFVIESGKARVTDKNRCMECGACALNCPAEAVTVEKGVGCASAVIRGWLTGSEPSCDCSGGECC
ncbi:MAG: 4Fe-4S binding protein [Oscillospiraceae bacterium]|jgi:NAD-dependent dihydropyrimidine dehydrogenase PreA subunit|nr:4Fe-4S binding protein [Oscillospiraceae bacterium]